MYDNIRINWDGKLLFSKDDILPLTKVLFKNHYVYIPKNSEKICQITYGDNWRIPINKKNYKWSEITKVKFQT